MWLGRSVEWREYIGGAVLWLQFFFFFLEAVPFFIITFSEDPYSLTKEFINKKEVAPLILRFLFELFEEGDTT